MIPQQRPNVVLIICHDLGDHIGPYGKAVEQTPRLNAFAEQAVRFDSHFVTSPGCSPSRASLVTGRYPHSNGMMELAHIGWAMKDGERTLAAYLKDHGYRTAMFGVWHLQPPPLASGFDHCDDGTWAEFAGPHAGDWIRAHGKSADGSPFFVMVGFWETHRPFCGNEEQRARADAIDQSRLTVPRYLPDNTLTRQDLAELHQSIELVDGGVGAVLDALDATGLSENTVVVFTADHGIPFPRAKATLYDPGLKVCLLVRWRGVARAGAARAELTSNCDVLPTLLAAVGAPVPDAVQGRSFLPLLTDGEGFTARAEVFAEKTYHRVYDPMRCVRTGRYKYVRSFEERPLLVLPTDIDRSLTRTGMKDDHLRHRPPEELYDLTTDPHEQRTLASDPAHANTLCELRARLDAWKEETDDPLRRGPVPRPRPITLEEFQIMARWQQG